MHFYPLKLSPFKKREARTFQDGLHMRFYRNAEQTQMTHPDSTYNVYQHTTVGLSITRSPVNSPQQISKDEVLDQKQKRMCHSTNRPVAPQRIHDITRTVFRGKKTICPCYENI